MRIKYVPGAVPASDTCSMSDVLLDMPHRFPSASYNCRSRSPAAPLKLIFAEFPNAPGLVVVNLAHSSIPLLVMERFGKLVVALSVPRSAALDIELFPAPTMD